MSRLLPCIALMLATTSPAYAKDVFTGTWKGDIKESELSTKPSVALIENGFYTCSTCIPVVKIAADGALHPVTGHAYYDAMSVTVVDPATVKYATSKAGKPMSDATATLSADNSSISTVFNDTSAPNGIPITGTTISERVAAGPSGSHAASGSWLQTNQTQVSDSGLVFTFAKTGKVVTYSTPTGTSYVATTGGPSVAVVGDAGWTTVSLRQSDLNTLHETDYLDGKVIGKYVMTISPDGKKMTMDVNDIKYGKTSTLIAYRQ
ncbi:hypothetical protein U1763_06980 [Sphingomonas sp. LB2R24]|uniref:hypothetical protein n=1 Tax=Sphingomonas sorbitolis TaxID=3096165 RepID=UPI002FC9F813